MIERCSGPNQVVDIDDLDALRFLARHRHLGGVSLRSDACHVEHGDRS